MNSSVACNSGRTPLYYACLNENAALVSFLLQKNADVNVYTCENRTPFSMGLGKNNKDICLLLIRNGLDLSIDPLNSKIHLDLLMKWRTNDRMVLEAAIDYEKSKRCRINFLKFLFSCKFRYADEGRLEKENSKVIKSHFTWLRVQIFSNHDLCRVIQCYL